MSALEQNSGVQADLNTLDDVAVPFANAINCFVLKIHLAGNRVLYLFASMDFLHDENFDELVLEQHFTQSLGMSDID